jgi:MATE family multidrug resistance protein
MNAWMDDLKKTAQLALPIVLSQVSQHLVQVMDSAMIGRVGVLPLAASAFASSVFSVPLVFCFGLTSTTSILASAAAGAGDLPRSRHVLRVGLVLVTAVGLVLASMLHFGRDALDHMGQTAAVASGAKAYFSILAWSMIPILIFACIKSYAEAMHRAWSPLIFMLIMLVMNGFLNWVFIFGKLGFAPMGLVGAGWATFISRWVAAILLAIWLVAQKDWSFRWRSPDWLRIRKKEVMEYLAIAIPSAFQIIFEVSAFVIAAVMMGWLGEISLAAHQIAINIAATTFMVTLGIAIATSVRIGHYFGENDLHGLRRTGFMGWLLSTSFMGVCMILLILGRKVIPTWFVTQPEVISMATKLLIIAAFFQMFDGIQITMIAALRGIRDVKWPTFLVMIAYYGICLPLAYGLGFPAGMGGEGIWIGLASGLAICALVLSLRFLKVSQHPFKKATI